MRRPAALAAALLAAALLAVSSCASGDGASHDRPSGAAGSGPGGEPGTASPAGPSAADAPAPAPSAPGGPLPGPRDPASLAAALVSAEQAIRDPARPVSRLEEPGRAQQEAYRQLVERPDWLPQVLASVPPWLHPTVRDNVTAGAELRALHKPRTTLPSWRIVPPAPAQELMGHYKAAEEVIGIPWQYLAAIHLVETRMGRIRGTSSAGAQGPMQFLPGTWRIYGHGGDINSNRDSILAAARLLARNGGPGNMSNALFNYNRSRRYVTAVSAYAAQMRSNERAYLGYYHWQVYSRLVDGDRLLPVGYGS